MGIESPGVLIRIGQRAPESQVGSVYGTDGHTWTDALVIPRHPSTLNDVWDWHEDGSVSVSMKEEFNLGDSYTTPVGPDNKTKKMIEVQCGYTKGGKKCGQWFVVVIKDFWQRKPWWPQQYKARACPYCFRVSKLPPKPKS